MGIVSMTGFGGDAEGMSEWTGIGLCGLSIGSKGRARDHNRREIGEPKAAFSTGGHTPGVRLDWR